MQLDCVGYIYETFKEQINLKNSKTNKNVSRFAKKAR